MPVSALLYQYSPNTHTHTHTGILQVTVCGCVVKCVCGGWGVYIHIEHCTCIYNTCMYTGMYNVHVHVHTHNAAWLHAELYHKEVFPDFAAVVATLESLLEGSKSLHPEKQTTGKMSCDSHVTRRGCLVTVT